MVTKRQNTKDHTVSAIFLIYSIFSNINQISLSSRKACNKLIIMTSKNGGMRMLVVELYSQLTEFNIKANQPCFNMHVHDGELNDAINYTQKGYAMQM